MTVAASQPIGLQQQARVVRRARQRLAGWRLGRGISPWHQVRRMGWPVVRG
jgi:hypothetical protein